MIVRLQASQNLHQSCSNNSGLFPDLVLSHIHMRRATSRSIPQLTGQQHIIEFRVRDDPDTSWPDSCNELQDGIDKPECHAAKLSSSNGKLTRRLAMLSFAACSDGKGLQSSGWPKLLQHMDASKVLPLNGRPTILDLSAVLAGSLKRRCAISCCRTALTYLYSIWMK